MNRYKKNELLMKSLATSRGLLRLSANEEEVQKKASYVSNAWKSLQTVQICDEEMASLGSKSADLLKEMRNMKEKCVNELTDIMKTGAIPSDIAEDLLAESKAKLEAMDFIEVTNKTTKPQKHRHI